MADPDSSATRRDACLLVTETEVGSANPFGDPVSGVEGWEFDCGGRSALGDRAFARMSAVTGQVSSWPLMQGLAMLGR
jgi:hypothetical protein